LGEADIRTVHALVSPAQRRNLKLLDSHVAANARLVDLRSALNDVGQFDAVGVRASSGTLRLAALCCLMMVNDVTRILNAIEHGDPQAADQLLPLVYVELRRLAARKMAREAKDHTLQPTALVHEAYVRLVGPGAERKWDSRGHFFAAAAEAMRRILIENARRKRSAKRGGKLARRELQEDDAVVEPAEHDNLLALDEALTKLAVAEPELAQLVELRYFAGLTVEQAAQSLGVSPRTAKRNWAYARAWLRREMDRE
jgi:RNA polymerase sigma factor (TIGR02999 family)